MGYANGTRYFETIADAVEACPASHDGDDNDLPDRQCPPRTKVMEDVTIGGREYESVAGGTVPAPMWATYMARVMEPFEPEGFPDPPPIPTTTMPDLVEAGSVDAARDLAEEAGLQLRVEEVTDWRSEGTIVGQQPDAGSDVEVGNFVTAEVSDGEGEYPRIPDVLGRSVGDARTILQQAGYAVGEFQASVSDPDADGVVLRQEPSAGNRMQPGSQVSIQVGVYVEPEPEPEPEPDPTGTPDPNPSETPGPTENPNPKPTKTPKPKQTTPAPEDG
jgi:hypothetical protein